MAGKPKTIRRPRKRDPHVLEIEEKPGEDSALAMARLTLRPTVQAAATLKDYGKKFGDLDLTGLVQALSEQTQATFDGDLQPAEAMLTTQAHCLDGIFHNLARRAINAKYMDNLDRYLKLALRAQSQSRATWETLATIKNPPVVGYVRQANIAHGHQQVNNAPAPKTVPSRTRANENPPNQLLEQTDGNRLDTRAPSRAGGTDSPLAAVGEVNRPKDSGG